MTINKPKVSIVTVCYNAANEIKRTMDSVLSQTSNEYEYIIVDGASADETCDLVKSYKNKFEMKNITFHFISEPDSGIYDAMNKSLKHCSGDWVVFMNAGDYFYSNNTICSILLSDYDSNTSVLYGGVVKVDLKSNLTAKEAPSDIENILKAMPFCHQSSFVRLSEICNRGFDLNFKIAADYDLFLDLYLQGKVFSKLNIYVSYFELGGISSMNKLKLYDDFLDVKHKYGLVNKNSVFAKLKRQFFILKNFILFWLVNK